MTIKLTWENIELTDKGSTVSNDPEVWQICGWLPEQLIEHGLARVTQPAFIDGAEYSIHPLKDLGLPLNGVKFTYDRNTNRFNGYDGLWLNASGFGKDFIVELVTMGEETKQFSYADSVVHPESIKSLIPGRQHPRNKYDREILPGVYIDVYDVLGAFKTDSAAIDHAVKKLLAPGQRGVKDRITDLNEAINSIQREVERLGEWGNK